MQRPTRTTPVPTSDLTPSLPSLGRMEGINRKIKTMLRQFYGLRDGDFLRLKLYALHQSKHNLIG